MSEGIKTTNAHGTVQHLVGIKAAEQAIRDVANYMQTMKEQESADTSRFFGALSAAATVVGAITSLVGLGKESKQSQQMVYSIELEICNGSSHVVASCKALTKGCVLTQAPRPLTRGESVSIIGEFQSDKGGFTPDGHSMDFVFVVGDEQKTIELSATFAYIKENRWCINQLVVDGTTISSEDIVPPFEDREGLQAIAFTGNDGYPSFSIYSHVIGYSEGKTYLAFLDLAPAA